MTFEKIDNFSAVLMTQRVPKSFPTPLMMWLISAGYYDFIHFIRDREDLFE